MADEEYAVDDAVWNWNQHFASMRGWAEIDHSDERAAREAMATLWSASGLQNVLPHDVMTLLIEATEVGYLCALRDVRAGDFDADLETWGRPST